MRAESGDAALHFRGRRLFRGNEALPVHAAHLHPSPEHDDFGSFRGAADGMALRLTSSDAVLHKHLCPADAVARTVFELLEQIRVEAMAPGNMPGLLRNLRHRHEQWSLAFHHSGLTETATGLLLYTVAQVCRARVTAQPVVDATEGVIEATRMALAPMLGQDLAALRRHRADQAAYARHALAIARAVAQAFHAARAADEFDKACNGGMPTACSNLGLMYRNGDGVARADERAVAYMQKACDLGMASACRWVEDKRRQ